MALDTGMKMIKTEKVTVENAAKTLGSGSLLVYGTPAMLLLVEKTAVALLDGHLDEGMTTVGTNLNVDHVSASPIGCEVSCEVTLTEIDRKKLTFAVEVKDPAGVIGKGTHERFIVDAEKFQEVAASLASSFSVLPAGGSAITDEGILVGSGASQLTELSTYYNRGADAPE